MRRCILVLAVSVLGVAAWAGEFVGPFPSWANVKTEFGAVGDGKADDTAAIQKALESVRRQDSPKKVLYFPAGTYRITSTLKLERISHHEPLGMSITGEDPEKTVIVWDGAAGQSMLNYGAWYASLSRLTFDGKGKAGTAIDWHGAFATASEVTDVIVKDVGFGIEAGHMDSAGIAEVAVLRCRFYRCSKAAISLQNFNSLDWYIWNCWFEDCGIAVCNEFGAGNFHLYYSTFLRSKDADLTIRHTSYLSFLGNTSIGSRRFFHAKRAKNWKDNETWGSQVTLQDNLVLDPADPTPIVIENNGPNLILDNQIRVRGEGPVIVNTPPADKADLIVIGNAWTVEDEKAIKLSGRLTELDNKSVKADAIADVKPTPAPFAARTERPIIEVGAGADAAAIQAAIDQAAGMKGKRPVVHLPKGNYPIAKTLTLPAGCDLLLIGDGPENATQLQGNGCDPVIRVQGPSHACFRSFLVQGGNGAVGIVVENCDQAGGRIFGEQLNTTGFEQGFVFDGLKQTYVELRDAGHNGLQVVGAGPETKPWVALFQGSSYRHPHHQAGIPLYDVRNGGRLLVRDIWYEGQTWSMVELKDCGEFAYHSGFVAPADREAGKLEWEKELRGRVEAFEFNGFRGRVAFTLVSSTASLRVKPPSPDLKVYLLGYRMDKDKMIFDLGGDALKGKVVAEHGRVARPDGTGSDALMGAGKASPEFIREMLKPLREVKPQTPTALKDDVSDIRFYRVWAGGKNGVRVQAGGAAKP